MRRNKKQALAALLAAVGVFAAGAFAPVQPHAAWWCTAFSLAPDEAAEPQPVRQEGVEYRLWLLDWLRSLAD